MNNNYLTHYGVLGMHWGRRRVGVTATRQAAYDKKDLDKLNNGGHLSVGLTKKRQAEYDKRDRERVERSLEKNTRKIDEAESRQSNDHKRKNELKRKRPSEMTNDELKELNNRLQLERQLKDLKKTDAVAGQKFVTDILKDVGRELLKDAIKTGIKTAIKSKK